MFVFKCTVIVCTWCMLNLLF